MKKFYDDQVAEKKMRRSQDKRNEQDLGRHIKDRVQTIDKLTDLDNTKRMLARGQLALENQTSAHIAKQKKDIMENQAKVDTIITLEANSNVNSQRADHQRRIKEQNRRMQLDQIQKQMHEKQEERTALKMKERAEHIRDLDLQNQMFERRQQGLNEHL